jgi:tetratricopeptide (TPR) repeat protein
VYLGEEDAKRGISYTTRRLDAEGQSFIFRADAAGTYGLQFYRQDFIRDYIINDHVRIIVEDGPALSAEFPPLDRGRVIAEPRWPELPGTETSTPAGAGESAGAGTAGAGAEESAGTEGAAGETALRPVIQDEGIVPVAPAAAVTPRGPVPEGTAELSPESLPEDYMARARREYEAGRVREALAVLDQFRERFPLGSDEAWWLYGQILEANSPVRDIRSALEYYRRLIREYPQSARYAAARQRIAYLERYYFDIR